jgi:hypothetical protein
MGSPLSSMTQGGYNHKTKSLRTLQNASESEIASYSTFLKPDFFNITTLSNYIIWKENRIRWSGKKFWYARMRKRFSLASFYTAKQFLPYFSKNTLERLFLIFWNVLTDTKHLWKSTLRNVYLPILCLDAHPRQVNCRIELHPSAKKSETTSIVFLNALL